jgi:hypothetical protein
MELYPEWVKEGIKAVTGSDEKYGAATGRWSGNGSINAAAFATIVQQAADALPGRACRKTGRHS